MKTIILAIAAAASLSSTVYAEGWVNDDAKPAVESGKDSDAYKAYRSRRKGRRAYAVAVKGIRHYETFHTMRGLRGGSSVRSLSSSRNSSSGINGAGGGRFAGEADDAAVVAGVVAAFNKPPRHRMNGGDFR